MILALLSKEHQPSRDCSMFLDLAGPAPPQHSKSILGSGAHSTLHTALCSQLYVEFHSILSPNAVLFAAAKVLIGIK